MANTEKIVKIPACLVIVISLSSKVFFFFFNKNHYAPVKLAGAI